jgi:hypothetical protein
VALVTLAECKQYLRVQGTAEDAVITLMRTAAIAAIQQFIRRPITAELRTMVVDADPYRLTSRFFLPIYPVAVEDSSAGIADIVVTDVDGVDLVQDTDFRFNRLTGEFLALSEGALGAYFITYPFTVTAYVGLSADPNYAERIEPAINAAILDIVSDRWHRRSPASTNESTGGGVSSSYDGGGLPMRVKEMLAPFVMARAL